MPSLKPEFPVSQRWYSFRYLLLDHHGNSGGDVQSSDTNQLQTAIPFHSSFSAQYSLWDIKSELKTYVICKLAEMHINVQPVTYGNMLQVILTLYTAYHTIMNDNSSIEQL